MDPGWRPAHEYENRQDITPSRPNVVGAGNSFGGRVESGFARKRTVFGTKAFVAVKFETASPDPLSACAVSAVVVQSGEIVEDFFRPIRPPAKGSPFPPIEGFRAADESDAKTFAELWAELAPVLRRGEVLIAHDARFAIRVLRRCSRHFAIDLPRFRFVCTAQLSRDILGLEPDLANVCARLSIPRDHHDSRSDAEAAARIFMAIQREVTTP